MRTRNVVIIIDALGFDVARRHGFEPQTLPHRTKLETVLGFSQAALTSMLTGSMPAEHGLWMMYSFASGRSPFAVLGPLRPLGGPDRRWVRRLLGWKLRRLDGITAYYSLYDIPGRVLELLDLPARGSIFLPRGGGEMESVIDAASREGDVFVRDYNTPEERAFDELEAALEDGRHDFLLLYTAGLDSEMHRHGTTDRRISEKLGWYADRIDSIVSRFPRDRFVVLGDHGMCDVTSHVDLMTAVERSGLRVPGDYVPFYDSTMARFRVSGEEVAGILAEILAGTGGGRVLSDDELRSLGVRFTGGRYGDIVYLCDTGTIILPSYMGSEPVKGMHGYHPSSSCMDSLMLSSEEFPGGDASITEVAGFLLPGFVGGKGG